MTEWDNQVHKRRCKQLKEPAYTIEEAERAGGVGREVRKRPATDVEMGAETPASTAEVAS